MTSNQMITAVILAGGRGARMNGRDKGLVPLGGRPLVAHVLEALMHQVGRILINANRNLHAYGAFGVPVLPDTIREFHGPLAGMLTGLRSAQTEWVLFVPCDAPWLPPDLARRLLEAVRPSGRAAYAEAHGDGLYTTCLLRVSLAGRIAERLPGRRSVREFLEECHAVPVAFPDWPAAARNLNTPADLRRAADMLGSCHGAAV